LAVASPRLRIESVDLVRGLIMVVMALDHVRDFFRAPDANPMDLATASAPLFLTRWVTHFCAPAFFLLMGVGARLASRRMSPGELTRLLATRGLWLIFVELVVIRCFAYQFNFDYRATMLVVLWALGWAMIALAALARLPTWSVTLLGAAMIACHNLLDSVGSTNPLWMVLHVPGVVHDGPHAIAVAYPLVPWIGVAAVGYGLGAIYAWESARRRAFLIRLGLALVAAFVVLRAIDRYGDPNPWEAQRTPLFTVLSFLATTKYPPSLAFLLMTLGPILVALALFDSRTPRALRPAIVFGKVPFFYYVVHFALIHALAVALCVAWNGSAHWLVESDLASYPFTAPPRWGLSLPAIYAIWVIVVGAMYVPCRWFASVKARHRAAWLSYL
jgi:uncharacterized membrane protein